jgi:hypothetical protein
MSYSSVQFLGKVNALKAFQNSDACNWSLLQGKQLIHKYEGTDRNESLGILTELLRMISESSGSEAVYTIRIYKYDEPEEKPVRPGAKPKKEVTHKLYIDTPYDGSFNFKLFDKENEISGRRQDYNELSEMRKEFAEMKLVLQQMVKEHNKEESEEKLSGMSGFLNGLLDVPEVKTAIAGKVVQLFNGVTDRIGGFLTGPERQISEAKIAGPAPEAVPAPVPIQMPQADINKINTALTILAKCDPGLPDNLSKLAMIAQTEPATYATLITMLNAKK